MENKDLVVTVAIHRPNNNTYINIFLYERDWRWAASIHLGDDSPVFGIECMQGGAFDNLRGTSSLNCCSNLFGWNLLQPVISCVD